MFHEVFSQGAVFQSVYNVLHFLQQWMRVSISKCACRRLLLSIFLFSQSTECQVVSHFGFNLQFPSDGLPWWLSGKESTWNAGGMEDPLEKEVTSHSSIVIWEIPWTEEPGGLQSMGSQRVGHSLATKTTKMVKHLSICLLAVCLLSCTSICLNLSSTLKWMSFIIVIRIIYVFWIQITYQIHSLQKFLAVCRPPSHFLDR